MNRFILTLVLSILSLIWPLSIVQARCGSSRNIGIGGNIQPFEVPAVDERVLVQGFALKVNRVKWSIRRDSKCAAIFKDDSTVIHVLRLPPLPPNKTLRDIARENAPPTNSRIRLENIRTTFNVRGLKASYGGPPSLLSQNLQLVRYYFQEPSGEIVCFEVSPTRKFADWSDSNSLILNTLSRAPLNSSSAFF